MIDQIDREKILTNVPCIVLKWDGHNIKHYVPKIDCAMDCENCGFDPMEEARRLSQGRYVTYRGIKTLHFMKGKSYD